jgi:DNA processing protein
MTAPHALAESARSIAEALQRELNTVERKHAPAVLFGQGRWEVLHSAPKVAILGSSRPTADGVVRATSLASLLARQRVTVLSGLATDVEISAHVAAIRAGGENVAVLSTPLHDEASTPNRSLLQQLMAEYLVVSPFDVGPKKPSTIHRYRLTALLADATIMAEAHDGSGSLHQAWECLRLGRPVFVCQSAFDDRSQHWARELQHHGAIILPDDGGERLLAALPACRGLGELIPLS